MTIIIIADTNLIAKSTPWFLKKLTIVSIKLVKKFWTLSGSSPDEGASVELVKK